jgi:hypothetical protein
MIELSVPHVRNEVRAILKEFVFGEWRNIPYDVYYLSGDAKGRHEHPVGTLSRQLLDGWGLAEGYAVGVAFWTQMEFQPTEDLIAIFVRILGRHPRNQHHDIKIFLDAPEWPEIDRLAREALSRLDTGDKEHGIITIAVRSAP